MEELLNGKPTLDPSFAGGELLIRFSNVRVIFNRSQDDSLDQRFLQSIPPTKTRVRYSVEFTNCTFDPIFWYLLRNVIFEQNVYIGNCSNLHILWRGVTVLGRLYITQNTINFLRFEDCRFYHGVKLHLNSYTDEVAFTRCRFELTPSRLGRDKRIALEDRLFYFSHRNEPMALTLADCRFALPPALRQNPEYQVRLDQNLFSNLRLNRDTVEAGFTLAGSAVENQFSVLGCQFEGLVFTEAFNFNPGNARVQWSSLAHNKLAVQTEGDTTVYTGKTVRAHPNEAAFTALVGSYANFYYGFRAQGNRLAGNACYVEWKEIETGYLAHLKTTDTDRTSYFSWLMNVFLAIFCDYGTNPVKAIRWSVVVMIAFAGVYFLFPQQSGLYQREGYFRHFLHYLRHRAEGAPLAGAFAPTGREDPADARAERQFKDLAAEHRRRLPWLLRLVALPFPRASEAFRQVGRQYLSWLDRQTLRAQQGGRMRRLGVGLVYNLTLLAGLLYYVGLRVLNSFTVSLNAFSTLGFGEIPVQGLARYLAIVEGFIGWFLLSIFSVALISQIIQ